MSLILNINFSNQQCQLIVTVADTADRGLPGTLVLVTDSNTTVNKDIESVTATPIVIPFETPKDGLVHQFHGTLRVADDERERLRYFTVCS